MKTQFLIIVSALCFGVIKSNVEASDSSQLVDSSQEQRPPLNRTCSISEDDMLDQTLYGKGADFLKNAFADAGSNFSGRGYLGHQQDKKIALASLITEGKWR